MTAVRPLGPGPGAYLLPPTIGFEHHDNRKLRNPQYSMGIRTGVKGKSIGPGPGAYLPEKVTRYGSTRGKEYSMGWRLDVKKKAFGPSPAQYDVHMKPIMKGSFPPAYSIGQRLNVHNKNFNPAPNAYTGDVSPIKLKYPAYSLGIRTKNSEKQAASPGPAAYGPGDIGQVKPRPPEYSMGLRLDRRKRGFGPGPNNYDLMYYRPGRTGESYSFGVRHHRYAPPMIVKCDNI